MRNHSASGPPARSAASRRSSSALQQLAGEIRLAGLVFLDQLPVPGEIAIDPSLDRVLVPSQRRHREPAGPAVVGLQGHGDLIPPGRPGGTVAEHRYNHIMPVAKYVGSHNHLFPNRSLDRESSAVNLWLRLRQ